MTRRTSMDPALGKKHDAGTAGLGLFEGAAAIEIPVRRTEVRAHLRRVAGSPLPSGAARKDAAQEAHELAPFKREAIAYLRRELVFVYDRRMRQWRASGVWHPFSIDSQKTAAMYDEPYLTADDVDAVLREWPRRPRILDTINGQWKGPTFKVGFEKTGRSVESRRPHMKATTLPCWRPVKVVP